MAQSTHDGTFQNAIDRCSIGTTQLTQMMMELSKSVSELKNEIKEKVGNRSHYNGSNNNSQWNRNNNNSDSNGSSNNSYNPTGGNRLPIQPQPAQFSTAIVGPKSNNESTEKQ
ncbi:3341_t:CDS:2 [Rhizophagus irregularis]|nr:3341_t:CDS:2 [Rhizophagus irregularis]